MYYEIIIFKMKKANKRLKLQRESFVEKLQIIIKKKVYFSAFSFKDTESSFFMIYKYTRIFQIDTVHVVYLAQNLIM